MYAKQSVPGFPIYCVHENETEPCLFYSTYRPGGIFQKYFDFLEERKVIVEDIGAISALSYDWASELLYFATGQLADKIEVVKDIHPDGDSDRAPMKNYMRRTIVPNRNE